MPGSSVSSGQDRVSAPARSASVVSASSSARAARRGLQRPESGDQRIEQAIVQGLRAPAPVSRPTAPCPRRPSARARDARSTPVLTRLARRCQCTGTVPAAARQFDVVAGDAVVADLQVQAGAPRSFASRSTRKLVGVFRQRWRSSSSSASKPGSDHAAVAGQQRWLLDRAFEQMRASGCSPKSAHQQRRGEESSVRAAPAVAAGAKRGEPPRSRGRAGFQRRAREDARSRTFRPRRAGMRSTSARSRSSRFVPARERRRSACWRSLSGLAQAAAFQPAGGSSRRPSRVTGRRARRPACSWRPTGCVRVRGCAARGIEDRILARARPEHIQVRQRALFCVSCIVGEQAPTAATATGSIVGARSRGSSMPNWSAAVRAPSRRRSARADGAGGARP